ncbi:MAG: peptide chain release factor 1 [Bacillariaceae sp.]|jgi:peptide chain release factor 1
MTTFSLKILGKNYFYNNITMRKRVLMSILPTSSTCPQKKHRRHFISPAFSKRLEMMVSQHDEILKKIEDNPDDGYLHGKELASLSLFLSLFEKKTELEAEETSIRDLLEEADGDEDMIKECVAELELIGISQKRLEKKIRIAILPKDENDYQSDAIVEIRAGTGGDEATLFASELREAYKKTARAMKWECDVMSENTTDLGGIKESVLSISGRASSMNFSTDQNEDEDDNILANIRPYGLFKYESGVHRVQRVPVNDTRIHTSACSVAVLPLKQDENKSGGELLPMSELKIETMRSSGPGVCKKSPSI